MLEIEIDNRSGKIWGVSELISSLRLKTSRFGKAGSAELTFVRNYLYGDSSFTIEPGYVVRIRHGKVNLFYGVVFIVDQSEDDALKVTAYDQIRYLLSADTHVFTNTTATAIIKKILDENKLIVGTLADTKYVIPKLSEDGQKLLDIIYKALDTTLTSDKKMFIFYDDFGKLSLTRIEDMILDVVIGANSLLYGYKYKRSIDSETYNRIKLVMDNKKTGKRDVYIEQDSSTIAKWGRLQYYRKVEEGTNPAQIKEAMKNLLELKNREQLTFTLDALGDPRLRAGSGVYIDLPELTAPALHLVNECTHNFEGDEHTMSLELVVFDYVHR